MKKDIMKQENLKFGFSRILSMVSIDSFASSLISLFGVIYLLELGFSFRSLIYYFIVHHTILLLFVFVAVWLSNKIGLVKVFFVRLFFLVGYLLALVVLPEYPYLFFPIAIMSGIQAAFYWTPFNILMVRKTEAKKMGASLSTLLVIPKAISFASPILAAFIITFFGFNILFVLTLVLFVLSTLPLLPLASEKTNFNFSWSKTKEIYQENKKFLVPEIIDNLAEDAMVFWSIFIFLSLDSVYHVGGIATTVGVVSLVLTMILGRVTDKGDKHRLLTLGAAGVSIGWFLNAIIASSTTIPWIFYVGTVFLSLTLKIFLIPYGAILYNRARKDDAQFLVLREIPTVGGRLVLFALALVFADNLPILFGFVGVLTLYFVFLDTRKLEG